MYYYNEILSSKLFLTAGFYLKKLYDYSNERPVRVWKSTLARAAETFLKKKKIKVEIPGWR